MSEREREDGGTSGVGLAGKAFAEQTFEKVLGGLQELLTRVDFLRTAVQEIRFHSDEKTPRLLKFTSVVEEISAGVEALLRVVKSVQNAQVDGQRDFARVSGLVQNLMETIGRTENFYQDISRLTLDTHQNLKDYQTVVETVTARSDTGQKVVTEMIKGMEEIQTSVSLTNTQLEQLKGQITSISKVTEIIQDVARETNLLSLNAAILAAQAGVHGRGFSVLAEEIRELADRTSLSTKEIASQIKIIVNSMSKAEVTMSGVLSTVKRGTELSLTSGKTLEQITAGSAQSMENLSSLSYLTEQQLKIAGEIADSLKKLFAVAAGLQEETSRIALTGDRNHRDVKEAYRLSERLMQIVKEQGQLSREISQFFDLIANRIAVISPAVDQLQVLGRESLETGRQRGQ